MKGKPTRRRRSQDRDGAAPQGASGQQGRPQKDVARREIAPADPILALRGTGAALWVDEKADAYVARLRDGGS